MRRSLASTKKKRVGVYKSFLFYFLIIIAFALLLKFTISAVAFGKSLKQQQKVEMVVRQGNNDIHVHVIDPKTREYTILDIPAQTLVNTSHGFGQWRIGSLWKFGEDEGLGGEILQKTLIRQFNFPVVFWADYNAESYVQGGLFKIFKILTGNFRSNLNLSDKMLLAYYSIKIPRDSRKYIDLKETRLLKEETLPDGDQGYVVENNFPDFLLPIFSNDTVSDLKIKISDLGVKNSEVGNVSKTIEVLGGKVSFIDVKEPKEMVCEVWANEESISKLFVKLFSCSIKKVPEQQGFDLEINLGSKFTVKN